MKHRPTPATLDRKYRLQNILLVFFLFLVLNSILIFLRNKSRLISAPITTKTLSPPDFTNHTTTVCAVILARIYPSDLAQLTLDHLLQWMTYMRFAGTTHIYFYDAYQHPNERLKPLFDHLLDPSFVTYHDWGKYSSPYSIDGTQVTAYQHAIDTYSDVCVWQMAFDLDEYPFSETDTEPNFLQRYVQTIQTDPNNLAEISLQNYLLLGPMNTDSTVWLAEKYTRLTKDPGNHLVKPIYRPAQVRANVHHNTILSGSHKDEKKHILRLAHIWGARIDNFQKTVSQHVLDITQDDFGLKQVIEKIRQKE